MDVDETEDVDILEVQVQGQRATRIGIARASGTVYLNGDLHPLGSFSALMIAAREHVPYTSVSAIDAMYPSEWLRAQCLHDRDRLRIIGNLESLARRAPG